MGSIKVSVFEVDGVEYDVATEYDLAAALNHIGYTASSGTEILFSRNGSVQAGTWLQNESIPSNITGSFISMTNPVINKIFVHNENSGNFSLEIYQHDGKLVNNTLVSSINISSSTGGVISVSIPVTQGKQLAMILSSGTVKNVVAGLEIAGS